MIRKDLVPFLLFFIKSLAKRFGHTVRIQPSPFAAVSSFTASILLPRLTRIFLFHFGFLLENKYSCSRAKGENKLKILFPTNFRQHVCFQLIIFFLSEDSGGIGTGVNVFVFHCPLVDGIRTAGI